MIRTKHLCADRVYDQHGAERSILSIHAQIDQLRIPTGRSQYYGLESEKTDRESDRLCWIVHLGIGSKEWIGQLLDHAPADRIERADRAALGSADRRDRSGWRSHSLVRHDLDLAEVGKYGYRQLIGKIG